MATKRGQNEGSITQRKDGRWQSRITVGYSKGKQVRKYFYGKTREEVAGRMADALSAHRKGQALPDERVSTRAFLDSWLEGTAKPRLRATTFARYKCLIEKHVEPAIGNVPVGKLTPQHLQKLWVDLQAGGLSARTVIQTRAILRTALNQAVKHSLTHRNAAALSDPPRAQKFKPAFLDPEQADQLLKKAQGHHLEGLVTLALTTGMRMGEILGLTWGDIDLEGKSLRICQQQQRVGKELLVTAPKTERSARSIPLTAQAVGALQRHKQTQIDELRSGIAAGRVMTGRVFTNEKGDPLENGTVLRQFQRLVKAAGLPKMRLHDLRHSCATLLLSKGVHPRVVMEILGHSTIAMTMNVYSHVVPQIARDAADALESIFSTCETPASNQA